MTECAVMEALTSCLKKDSRFLVKPLLALITSGIERQVTISACVSINWVRSLVRGQGTGSSYAVSLGLKSSRLASRTVSLCNYSYIHRAARLADAVFVYFEKTIGLCLLLLTAQSYQVFSPLLT